MIENNLAQFQATKEEISQKMKENYKSDLLMVVRNKKSKFFSHRYLIEIYETNRMSHVPHLYDVVNLLK